MEGVMSSTFCSAEEKAFDDAHFASTPTGVQIHVISAHAGHTTEGWPATYSAARDGSGGWALERVLIHEPAIVEPDADVAPDDVG
jgi:hypothetical protein